jgi:hypothetical protein
MFVSVFFLSEKYFLPKFKLNLNRASSLIKLSGAILPFFEKKMYLGYA